MEIGHKISPPPGLGQTTSSTFVKLNAVGENEILAADLVANATYMLLAGFHVSGNSTAANIYEAKISDGAGDLAGADFRLESRQASSAYVGQHYGFLRKYTAPATPTDIEFQVKSDGIQKTYTKEGQFFALKIDDLVENTDYFYAEDWTTVDANVASGSWTDRNSITIGDGVSDWLILAYSQWLIDNNSDDLRMQIDVGGTPQGEIKMEGEDPVEVRPVITMTYAAALASGTVVKNQIRTTGAVHDCTRSSIIAIRLNAFEDHFGSYNTTDVSITALNTDFEVSQQNHTAVTAATRNWCVIGQASILFTDSKKRSRRHIRLGGVDVAGNSASVVITASGAADIVQALAFDEMSAVANGTNMDVDMQVLENVDIVPPPVSQEAFVCGFTWELAAGGTTFTQSTAGALSFGGGLVKETQKLVVGTLDFAGALTTSAFMSQSVAGALSFNGALTKSCLKFLAGVLTLDGAISKETQKALSGVLSFAGATNKETQRLVAGVLSFAGNLNTTAVFTQDNTGALTFVGVISKGQFVAVDGTLSFSGAISKEIRKNLTGALTFDGTIAKLVAKQVSGELSFAGNVATSLLLSKAVIGTLSFVGAVATLFTPGGGGGGLRRMWRSLWSRVWKAPGKMDEDT